MSVWLVHYRDKNGFADQELIEASSAEEAELIFLRTQENSFLYDGSTELVSNEG